MSCLFPFSAVGRLVGDDALRIAVDVGEIALHVGKDVAQHVLTDEEFWKAVGEKALEAVEFVGDWL